MCGVSGIWDHKKSNINELLYIVKSMANSLKSRGPDSSGDWICRENGIALSHSRLSIIDLSELGNQPMISENGNYIIVFNGEIYNHKYLRKILKKAYKKDLLKGSSDTEILLSMIQIFGIRETLIKSVGMFALAIWDKDKQTLTLARDRFGEKPLYWGWDDIVQKNKFIFTSDLIALKSIPFANLTTNHETLSIYLNRGYIPAPYTIFKEINQLKPGYLLEVSKRDSSDLEVKSFKWWDTQEEIMKQKINYESDEEALFNLEEQLIETIKEQSISDVPLGIFLSGGIDSSLITALFQFYNKRPIESFTIGFPELSKSSKGFNEGNYAKIVSNYLGTNHNQIELSNNEAKRIIPNLSKIYSEPFADSSQIPSHLICKEAKDNGISVALTGDGGDELFGGYNRHIYCPSIQRLFSFIPKNIRNLIAEILLFIPSSSEGLNLDKRQKLAELIRASNSLESAYKSITSCWDNPSEILSGKNHCNLSYLKNLFSNQEYLSAEEKIMFVDILSYLPNDILVKMDRASMATSFETRAPFLDHRIAQIAWRMSPSMKIRKIRGIKYGKYALRSILKKYLPTKYFERPKAGFALPIGQWLITDKYIREWAEDLLNPETMAKQGFLNPKEITISWQKHLTGKENNYSKIWTILMWQSWLKEWSK